MPVRSFHLTVNCFFFTLFQFYFVFIVIILRIVYFKGKNNVLPVLDIWKVSFSIRASIYEKLFFKEFIIKSKSFVVLIFLNLFFYSWALSYSWGCLKTSQMPMEKGDLGYLKPSSVGLPWNYSTKDITTDLHCNTAFSLSY